MLTEAALWTFVAGLFSMLNPIGTLGVFAGMTADRSDTEARRIA
jgi:small neutral amino acid transporter SnatA (MarC family)